MALYKFKPGIKKVLNDVKHNKPIATKNFKFVFFRICSQKEFDTWRDKLVAESIDDPEYADNEINYFLRSCKPFSLTKDNENVYHAHFYVYEEDTFSVVDENIDSIFLTINVLEINYDSNISPSHSKTFKVHKLLIGKKYYHINDDVLIRID